jgi:menaquinone-dependent protoporphyrinogen IX oxidase
MLRIVKKQLGSDVDTRRDYEYTDWNDVRAFARAFRQKVVPTRTLRPAV